MEEYQYINMKIIILMLLVFFKLINKYTVSQVIMQHPQKLKKKKNFIELKKPILYTSLEE